MARIKGGQAVISSLRAQGVDTLTIIAILTPDGFANFT